MNSNFAKPRTPNPERYLWFSLFSRPDHRSGKSVIVILNLLPVLLLLTCCGKSQLAHKPTPTEIPGGQSTLATQRIIEVNGRRISPLVPTLFLLPGEPLVIRSRPISVLMAQSQRVPSAGDPLSPLPESVQAANYPARSDNRKRGLIEADGEGCSVLLDGRTLARTKNNLFIGTAPPVPGLYKMEIAFTEKWQPAALSQMEEVPEALSHSLLLIVLHPLSRLEYGFIDQFPMGFYPDPQEPLLKTIPKDLFPLYRPPKGFISVTAENQGIFISRHFRLQDLDCRLKAPLPHYMALSPELLLKLEILTLKVKRWWGPEARIVIQSGFRTPWHNLAVSGALWSRHIYGDAADIIVSNLPPNGLMGDLNQDGRIDLQDTKTLARMIEEVENETGLVGGLGLYDWGENGRHGPFVHTDCRGTKARW
jgi:hypothetical protein